MHVCANHRNKANYRAERYVFYQFYVEIVIMINHPMKIYIQLQLLKNRNISYMKLFIVISNPVRDVQNIICCYVYLVQLRNQTL